MAKNHTREEYIRYVLPYRMKAVSVFNLALRYVIAFDTPGKMEIYFNDKCKISSEQTHLISSVQDHLISWFGTHLISPEQDHPIS
jgi:hypothetical protein